MNYQMYYYAPFVQTAVYTDSGTTMAVLALELLIKPEYTWKTSWNRGLLEAKIIKDANNPSSGQQTGEGLKVKNYYRAIDITRLTVENTFQVKIVDETGDTIIPNGEFMTNVPINLENEVETPNPDAEFVFLRNNPLIQLVQPEYPQGNYSVAVCVKLDSGYHINSMLTDVEAGTMDIYVCRADQNLTSFSEAFLFEEYPVGQAETLTVTVHHQEFCGDSNSTVAGGGNLDFNDASAGADPVVSSS